MYDNSGAIAITSFGDDAEKNTSYNSNASNEIGKIGITYFTVILNYLNH